MIDRNIIGIFGLQGSGKTAWIKDYVSALPRFIVVDNGKSEFSSSTITVFNKKELVQNIIGKGKFRISYLNGDEDDEQNVNDVSEIASAYTQQIQDTYKLPLPITIIIDEAQNYTSPYKTPKGLKKALMMSRHNDLSFIFSTQRPAQISKNLTSQSSRFIIYKLVESRDVNYFTGFLGVQAMSIPHLKKYHYLDVDLDNNTVVEKML